MPARPEAVALHPVSTEVNNVRNKAPHLVDPIELDDDGQAEPG